MKTFYNTFLSLLLFFCMLPALVKAQYCTPTVTTTGVRIVRINFDRDITNGGKYDSPTNKGYSAPPATSSGTLKRFFGGTFYYSIGNSSTSNKNCNFSYFSDWNNDGDFLDAGELVNLGLRVIVPTGSGSTTTDATIVPPLNIAAGNYRIRMVLSEPNASLTAGCGSITGEVQDYVLTVSPNVAPVLASGYNLPLNPILSSETNSNGISINEIVESLQPVTVVTDADDRGAQFTEQVPRGIAIYQANAGNGKWQYKKGTGTWTDFGTLSNTNALLLLGDSYYTDYKSLSRIRFVPTGAGTPTISLKAWDGTNAESGSYKSVATTGGTTAFSTNNITASLKVLSPASYVKDIYLASQNKTIYNASIDKTAKTITNPEVLLTNATDAPFDMELDKKTKKLYWIAGEAADKIASSNADGSSVNLALVTDIVFATGLAVGNDFIYYLTWTPDYDTGEIYRVKTDGTQKTKIFTGNAYWDIRDIELYENKLYFQYQDSNDSKYKISSVSADGSGFANHYSTDSYFSGLAVSGGFLYWTETGGIVGRKSITSGSSTILVSETGRTFGDLIVDNVNSTVYFADISGNEKYSLIRRVSTSSSALRTSALTAVDLTTVATVGGMVNSLTFNAESVALPVTLINFSGRLNETETYSFLSWSTASEVNNDKFILERSTDGRYFRSVSTIRGAGTSASVNSYQFSDDLSQISSGILYYRLLQVDLDGTKTYSKIISLSRKGAEPISMKVFPNPGRRNFVIGLSSKPEKPVQIRIFSKDGKLVQSDNFNSQEYGLDMKNSPAGIYLVKLNFDNGTEKQVRFIND